MFDSLSQSFLASVRRMLVMQLQGGPLNRGSGQGCLRRAFESASVIFLAKNGEGTGREGADGIMSS